MSDPRAAIHVWTPGIRDDTGGIQAFSRFFVRSLREGFPERPIRVFVKNEALPEDDPLNQAGIHIHSFAGVPMPVRSHVMAASGIWHGMRERPACALSTHLHFFTAMRILKTATGIPYGGVLHGIEAWRIKSATRIAGLRNADHLMAVSQFTKERVLAEYGLVGEQVSVVPNTYDEERFRPGPKPPHLLEKYGLSPDQPVLLTVSRLALSERYKGHWQALMALKRARETLPDVHYLVVGAGDELAHLRNAVRTMDLEKNVTFTGFVPAAELPDHFRLCDAFVMPSTKEGFGIVFLEAAGCGKPAIAGNLDGSVDAVDHGRLGILVDPHHSGQIAEAMLAALSRSHPNKLLFEPDKLSAAVSESFGFESFKRLLVSEVDSLLSGKLERASKTKTPSPRPSPAAAAPAMAARAPRIVVLTQLNSPYQVEFFNRVASAGDCHLEVIYLTSKDKNRKWTPPNIAHSHIILTETPQLRSKALESLLSADIAVFNYYTDWFAWNAIRLRARTGKPWTFWGERPGFLHIGPPGRWFRAAALKPLRNSRAPIWGVGRFGTDGYRKEFGGERAYMNVPYYSELGRFSAAHRVPGKNRTVLYSGAFSKRKGSDLLARAFAAVAAERDDVRLLLIGEGELEPEMREILQPCIDRVAWGGFQPWEKLPRFYARSDVFCFPSRYDGWGLALVEALAAGLPVIGTDQTGSAMDLVRPGENGWIVQADHLESLTAALREAVSLDNRRLAEMQTAARLSVQSHSIEHGTRHFIQIANETIRGWQP